MADLNAVAPATARRIAERLQQAGLDLVDGSISGPPPTPGGATRLYLSGPRAGEVAALEAPGLLARVVGSHVGTASAIKMSTASVYKGTTALLAQALLAAAANGVLAEVADDLRDSFASLLERAPAALARAATKAERYVPEMREIAATQAAAGLTPALFEGMAAVYEALAAGPLAELDPEQVGADDRLEDVLCGLLARQVEPEPPW